MSIDKIVYRGTQTPVLAGFRVLPSYTDSLQIAQIWSAVPGDALYGRKAHFLDTSTVTKAHLEMASPILLPNARMSLGELLRILQYGQDGISYDESIKIYNYLHNRLIGKARGGEISVQFLDEDGEAIEEELTFSNRTIVSTAKEAFEIDELEAADRLIVDTFALVDAPAVFREAKKLGHDGILHKDIFQGGERGARELLGEEVYDLEGVEEEFDFLAEETYPIHDTYRPFDPSQVTVLSTLLAKDIPSHGK
jgi:hypothetical protein